MQSNDAILERAVAPEQDELQARRAARRGAIKIRRLHHHALRTNNMERTRVFYEDLLGMRWWRR